MERIQPFYKLNTHSKTLEVWNTIDRNRMSFPKSYLLTEEDIPIVEKLIERDLKTAILYRRSKKEFIVNMCNDILEQKG